MRPPDGPRDARFNKRTKRCFSALSAFKRMAPRLLPKTPPTISWQS
jgi:hypothetical protein